ncbi:hypothetical protein [Gordonia aurantiaca]|uniref:hypothetical protein n=1 Tax=Gordonia sp. B21 TaxID=3151852 RepID=UPI0032648EF6
MTRYPRLGVVNGEDQGHAVTSRLRRPITTADDSGRTQSAAALVVDLLIAYQAVDGGPALHDDHRRLPGRLQHTPFDPWTVRGCS